MAISASTNKHKAKQLRQVVANNYANFLADHVRLTRPLPSSSTQQEGVCPCSTKTTSRCRGGRKDTRKVSEAKLLVCSAVSASLGVNRAQSERAKSESVDSSGEETSKGLEPDQATGRKQQPGAVTVCGESISRSHPPTTRNSSSRPPTTRCTLSARSTVPPTVGYNWLNRHLRQ